MCFAKPKSWSSLIVREGHSLHTVLGSVLLVFFQDFRITHVLPPDVCSVNSDDADYAATVTLLLPGEPELVGHSSGLPKDFTNFAAHLQPALGSR